MMPVVRGFRFPTSLAFEEIATDKIPNETAKWVGLRNCSRHDLTLLRARYAVDQYLNVGDWVLAQGSNLMSKYPDYFNKK